VTPPGQPTLQELEAQLASLDYVTMPPKKGSRFSSGTVRGLMDALNDEEPSHFLVTAEGGTFLGGHAFTDEQLQETCGCLCAIWSGDDYDYRKGGQSWRLTGKRLATLILAQPTIIAPLLNNATVQDMGLLARMMIVRPDRVENRPLSGQHPPGYDQAGVNRALDWIASVYASPPNLDGNGKLVLHDVVMPDHLMDRVRDTEAYLRRESVKGGKFEHLQSFTGKYVEHIKRIATVIEVTNHEALLEPPTDGPVVISEASYKNAKLLMDFQLDEHVRLFTTGEMEAVERDAFRLLELVNGERLNPHKRVEFVVERSQINQLCGSGSRLKKSNNLKVAIQWLVDNHWCAPCYVDRRAAIRLVHQDLFRENHMT
jgi:hypothetical protein